MVSEKKSDVGTGTLVDGSLARPRPKEGLIPARTGLYLQIESGSQKGRVFDLSRGGTYLIGRAGADISLDDPKVSRKHAELALLGPDAYLVRDLASTNGTLLNGRILGERAKLKHDDTIQIGDTTLTFTIVQSSIHVDEKG